jgi:hypothetical protein
MKLATKQDIINDAIVKLNELVDARGADKCILIIQLIQNLNELGHMVKEEDANHEAAVLSLTEKITKLEKEANNNGDSESE